MAKHPIFTKVFHGDLNAVRELLDADPSLVDLVHNELTPLHTAAQRNHPEIIELLVSKGAKVNHCKTEHEWTSLVWASYRGHLDSVKTLLDLGADPALSNPIHFAGQRGHKEISRVLVEHGAIDHLIRDDPERLELFKACYSFDHESVSRLLARNPKLVHSQDVNGKSALHEVATNGDLKTAKVLLQYGIPTDLADSSGHTAIDRARTHSQKKMLALLESD